MLDRILAFFKDNTEETQDSLTVTDASAIMLIEVMMADHDLDPREYEVIVQILMRRTQSSEADVRSLLTTAQSQHKASVDFFQYTHLVNTHWNEEERYEFIVDLWRVAFADGDLDKYEDQRIRRINDLLHLHHSHFIKAKAEAKNAINRHDQ